MNIAIQQMMRKRRQREGLSPLVTQPRMPAGPSYLQDAPLTFAHVAKDEQQQRTNFFSPPQFDPNELVELPTSYKPDSELDPINTSDEFAEGLKIRPWAHIRVPSYMAVAEWEGVDNSDFDNGWILNKGEFAQLVSQYVGGQHPIDVSPLIPEAEYTTYGATNQLQPGQIAQMPTGDGYLFD